jgi:hypothetical protein
MRVVRFISFIAIWLVVVSSRLAAAINIVMVTTNNGTLTTTESGRKSYLESLGYTVNTIWDGASQATFNTAFAANRAVTVGDEVTAGDLGYKLREATIGVVSEHTSLVDELGLCTSSTTTASSSTISIVNNTHYITRVFSTGALSLGTGTYNINRMGGTTASGAVVLATVGASDTVVAAETGATLANTYNASNVAYGRRVQFPLPVSVNDSSSFGANTYTLADRMLAWAAGLDRTLVAHWRLNETSGTTAADSSGFDRTGTVTGTATWTPAVRNNGFSFNGSTRIQATGLLGNHANLTVTAWANLTAADTSGAEIISLGDHFYIRLDESGWARAYMYNGSSWLSVGVYQTFAGTGWHHFAAVFDDDNNVFKFYVDGAMVASTANTSSISYAGLGANTIIGRHGNSGTSHDFTGIIDEVRVYNYALSDTDIATLYGFIGHWKLDETAGTTAADSTIFARHGTVTGGATWSTRCNGDGAFDFNGNSQYISIPDAAHLRPTESLTIAAWIRGDSWSSADVVNLILRKGENNPNNYQLAIGNGRVCLSLDANDPAPIQSSTVLAAGQWYHVAATWDGAYARIYVNGQLDGSPVARSGPIGTDTRPVYIGGRSGATDFFDGMIYDVRFYNRALGAADVAKLAGLWGHWRFAEGTGSSAADSSGVGNNATLSGGATWMTDCAGNKALQTSGTGGIAQTASAFTPPDAGTVAFWMQSVGNPVSQSAIFGLGNNWEARQLPNGVIVFDLCGEGSNNCVTTRPLVETNRWYHVAATFDSATDSYAVYIDGKLDKAGTNTNPMTQQAGALLTFGNRTGATQYWQGALRDFRIYKRKLCASEIAELYGLVGHWKLDETSGTLAADSSGLGRNGTVIGTANWTSGSVDGALQVNGLTRVEVNSLMGSPRNVTLAAWAYLTTADSAGSDVVSLGDYFAFRLNDGTVSRAFFYNGTTWVSAAVTQTFTPGWHHFAAVFNDDLNVCKFFVDGAEAASVATTVTIPYGGLGTKLVIGSHGNGQTSFDLTGMIDDVRVYNRALCATEVADIEEGGEPFGGVKIIKWVEIQ